MHSVLPTGDVHTHFEQQRQAIVELCAQLVAAPSVNPPGDTRAVAEVVRTFLTGNGQSSQIVSTDAMMPSVVAVVDSGRPGRTLTLNVHLDTMPPGPLESWSVDPFTLTAVGERLYGLGMGNMKGAVAAMSFALVELARRREEWNGRIVFTAVSDEVVFGANGAQHLLSTLPELPGDALICGEGAGFGRLAVGEKGVLWLEISTHGVAGHASAVQRDTSASARIASAVSAIDALTGFAVPADPTIVDADSAFTLSANVGVIEAGSFIGQIATFARAEVDLRIPPGLTLDVVEGMVRERIDAAVGPDIVTVQRLKGWDPNQTDMSMRLGRSWLRASHEAGFGVPDLAIRLPASDASRWRRVGVDALCFGPQPFLSAGVDDFAYENDVVDCAVMYVLAALAYLGPNGENSEQREGGMDDNGQTMSGDRRDS